MADVYLGLGSNVGDKATNLRAALWLLNSHRSDADPDSVIVLQVSSLFRTDPVGYLDQDWFLNVVAHIETRLGPRELLNKLIAIERKLGRVRTVRNGPRIIDLDILLWQDRIVCEDDLVIPHPRLHERLFVLEPLAEIAPDARHPVLGLSVAECLALLTAGCEDAPGVFRIDGPGWAAAPTR